MWVNVIKNRNVPKHANLELIVRPNSEVKQYYQGHNFSKCYNGNLWTIVRLLLPNNITSVSRKLYIVMIPTPNLYIYFTLERFYTSMMSRAEILWIYFPSAASYV